MFDKDIFIVAFFKLGSAKVRSAHQWGYGPAGLEPIEGARIRKNKKI